MSQTGSLLVTDHHCSKAALGHSPSKNRHTMCACHGRTLFRLVFVIYAGPQLSHQNQMLTANYKSLTANSNRSQQIQVAHGELQIAHSKLQIAHSELQIAHSELQIAHSKLQIDHSKFKSTTANSNLSQQIKVAHSKFKGLPFCLGLRVFFRVSRVHCRGSLFYKGET